MLDHSTKKHLKHVLVKAGEPATNFSESTTYSKTNNSSASAKDPFSNSKSTQVMSEEDKSRDGLLSYSSSSSVSSRTSKTSTSNKSVSSHTSSTISKGRNSIDEHFIEMPSSSTSSNSKSGSKSSSKSSKSGNSKNSKSKSLASSSNGEYPSASSKSKSSANRHIVLNQIPFTSKGTPPTVIKSTKEVNFIASPLKGEPNFAPPVEERAVEIEHLSSSSKSSTSKNSNTNNQNQNQPQENKDDEYTYEYVTNNDEYTYTYVTDNKESPTDEYTFTYDEPTPEDRRLFALRTSMNQKKGEAPPKPQPYFSISNMPRVEIAPAPEPAKPAANRRSARKNRGPKLSPRKKKVLEKINKLEAQLLELNTSIDATSSYVSNATHDTPKIKNLKKKLANAAGWKLPSSSDSFTYENNDQIKGKKLQFSTPVEAVVSIEASPRIEERELIIEEEEEVNEEIPKIGLEISPEVVINTVVSNVQKRNVELSSATSFDQQYSSSNAFDTKSYSEQTATTTEYSEDEIQQQQQPKKVKKHIKVPKDKKELVLQQMQKEKNEDGKKKMKKIYKRIRVDKPKKDEKLPSLTEQQQQKMLEQQQKMLEQQQKMLEQQQQRIEQLQQQQILEQQQKLQQIQLQEKVNKARKSPKEKKNKKEVIQVDNSSLIGMNPVQARSYAEEHFPSVASDTSTLEAKPVSPRRDSDSFTTTDEGILKSKKQMKHNKASKSKTGQNEVSSVTSQQFFSDLTASTVPPLNDYSQSDLKVNVVQTRDINLNEIPQKIQVGIIEVDNIPKVDTFCVAYIADSEQAHKTKTISYNNPKKFNEVFTFNLKECVEQNSNKNEKPPRLVVLVKKQDLVSGDRLLGYVKIPLNAAHLSGNYIKWVPMFTENGVQSSSRIKISIGIIESSPQSPVEKREIQLLEEGSTSDEDEFKLEQDTNKAKQAQDEQQPVENLTVEPQQQQDQNENKKEDPRRVPNRDWLYKDSSSSSSSENGKNENDNDEGTKESELLKRFRAPSGTYRAPKKTKASKNKVESGPPLQPGNFSISEDMKQRLLPPEKGGLAGGEMFVLQPNPEESESSTSSTTHDSGTPLEMISDSEEAIKRRLDRRFGAAVDDKEIDFQRSDMVIYNLAPHVNNMPHRPKDYQSSSDVQERDVLLDSENGSPKSKKIMKLENENDALDNGTLGDLGLLYSSKKKNNRRKGEISSSSSLYPSNAEQNKFNHSDLSAVNDDEKKLIKRSIKLDDNDNNFDSNSNVNRLESISSSLSSNTFFTKPEAKQSLRKSIKKSQKKHTFDSSIRDENSASSNSSSSTNSRLNSSELSSNQIFSKPKVNKSLYDSFQKSQKKHEFDSNLSESSSSDVLNSNDIPRRASTTFDDNSITSSFEIKPKADKKSHSKSKNSKTSNLKKEKKEDSLLGISSSSITSEKKGPISKSIQKSLKIEDKENSFSSASSIGVLKLEDKTDSEAEA
ncbi:hypothetical protein TRFO_06006 [Tritrichomonas foetus]|uniref:C2 domain-containing protein n=1 Tax=Tritrichomonas foetus TaxID=1144522 RepID=A0A1J4K5N4_9EUKA|nr:hypothetical protein TRFO_06006 [Tritrichomonas foetus]|eukprot:OHT05036.1 hypothetical protein TRFO_06006 [Tritrichomonas foetus]